MEITTLPKGIKVNLGEKEKEEQIKRDFAKNPDKIIDLLNAVSEIQEHLKGRGFTPKTAIQAVKRPVKGV